MRVVDGHIRDANMNYVCAAGTGSFVEEQAQEARLHGRGGRARRCWACAAARLRPLHGVHGAGRRPAHPHRARRREEALAAVMVSVVKNYLNKVVGNRPRSRDKIFFQGATARNKGLVAAFESLLGVEIVVSPYCHVMGAYGVALLTRRVMQRAGAAPSAASAASTSTSARSRCRRTRASCARTTARSRSPRSKANEAAVVGLHVRARAGRAEDAPDARTDRLLRRRSEALARGRARHRRARRCARSSACRRR